jgi:redox-sensitive bicupin YhaK (pirin superfamily)
MAASAAGAVLSVAPMTGAGPMDVPDPFIFCVFHLDNYPAGHKDHMHAPRRGNGADFDPAQPYRMYHGSRVPGFPRHPHRGFETLTIVLQGLVDHADSLGSSGRYGEGDMQWLTAAGGVQHQEMFPVRR